MKSAHEPGHLLVVDDNKVNRILLSRGLEQQGHQIDTAENGKQALEKLRADSFDLVLLDIEMPEMNGYQVLETCLQDPELRDIPIIMTSSLDEIDSVVKCVELGAEDYLNKPVNPILLRARVNASLEKKRLRDEQRKLFRTFATKEVADELLRSGFSLGGEYVNASVMFADIRSFTTIGEKQEPADTIELLNNYFALMFDAIVNNHGMVNQLEGDGFMAIFGAPIYYEGHREHAVRAALEMIEMLKVFNIEQAAQNKVQIKIGIGIASGRVIAGYTGTQHRATYTCVGDTVNIAARIEKHTKETQRPILIDQYTKERLPKDIEVEALGPVLFQGKQRPIYIFAVKG
ncbi:MAG: adenylate/guanylate cyclase domain-containing response regulator [Anaerolineae bacterium]|nr:adenylate/guanylate cyclase domain-containing response regulator [Anaerolineae bacterium]MCI0609023.1 adenylate/guanylate cyclase domain-containing response regulator [Anaerolineae bacterium]